MTTELEQLKNGGAGLLESEICHDSSHMKATALRSYGGQQAAAVGDDQITEYLPMVSSIARKVVGYCRPPLSFEDLVSAGTIGLIKAARDYDPSRQAQFKTYAYIRIKGAILDELRSASMLPTAMNKQVKEAFDVSRQMTEETGRSPSDEELAQRLEISREQLGVLFDNARAQRFVSLDNQEQGGQGAAELVAAAEMGGPQQQLEKAELIERMSKAIAELDEKRRRIVLLYYQQHLTMKQVAEVLNVTESRVCQLHASALFNLSSKLRDWNDGEC